MNVNVICVAKVVSTRMLGRVGSMGCLHYIAQVDLRKCYSHAFIVVLDILGCCLMCCLDDANGFKNLINE